MDTPDDVTRDDVFDDDSSSDLQDTAVSPALDATGSAERISTQTPSATNAVASGFSAMRAVRQASKMRADAQADLREIERGLEEDKNELYHREDIEAHYDEIIDVQGAAAEEARAEIEDCTTQIRENQKEMTRLTEELRRVRERHEQKLRPYRNLADSSRGRSDDAAKALANARRDLRAAERSMTEATKTRDARIAAAHRDVDNAQERLSAVYAEQADTAQTGDEQAIMRVEAELASEEAHLTQMRSEVERITRQEQENVQKIQQNLIARQRDLANAERVAEAAKEEATARKDEYDALYKEAQTKERLREDAIKSREETIRDLKKTRKAAEGRLQEAEELLDEANQIHAHPEVTEGLRLRIADEERDLEAARLDLNDLKQSEQELRRSTRGSRVIFIVVAIIIVALIALAVWYFALK